MATRSSPPCILEIDFDIDGSTQDLALEYNSNTPNLGYGPGWHKKSVEIVKS